MLLLPLSSIVEDLAVCNMLRMARTAADRADKLFPISRKNGLWTGTRVDISRIEVGVGRLHLTQLLGGGVDLRDIDGVFEVVISVEQLYSRMRL